MLIVLALLGCDAINDDRDPADGCASEPIGLWLEIGGDDDCLFFGDDGTFSVRDVETGADGYQGEWLSVEEDGAGGYLIELDNGVVWVVEPDPPGECAASDEGPWVMTELGAANPGEPAGACPANFDDP